MHACVRRADGGNPADASVGARSVRHGPGWIGLRAAPILCRRLLSQATTAAARSGPPEAESPVVGATPVVARPPDRPAPRQAELRGRASVGAGSVRRGRLPIGLREAGIVCRRGLRPIQGGADPRVRPVPA